MLAHQLSRETGVLTLAPSGPLTAADFAAVAAEVDPWIAVHGALSGVLIHARAFPGWENFAGLVSHLRFVRDHHRLIRRIAVVSDSTLLAFAPKLANHFVSAEVRAFDGAERAAALAWIEGR